MPDINFTNKNALTMCFYVTHKVGRPVLSMSRISASVLNSVQVFLNPYSDRRYKSLNRASAHS